MPRPPTSRQFDVQFLAYLLLAALSACQAPAPVKTDVGFKFIRADTPAPSAKNSSTTAEEEPLYTTTFVEAEAIKPLAPPVFPPALRGQFSGVIAIGVRIVVDQNGRVSRIEDSLRSLTTPHRLTPALRTAVETAVTGWRFKPAQLLQLKANVEPDGSRWWSTVRRDNVETNFDLAFTFSASGQVTTP